MLLGVTVYSQSIGNLAKNFINNGSIEACLFYKKVIMDSFCDKTNLSN
jgi:hypothetical protein